MLEGQRVHEINLPTPFPERRKDGYLQELVFSILWVPLRVTMQKTNKKGTKIVHKENFEVAIICQLSQLYDSRCSSQTDWRPELKDPNWIPSGHLGNVFEDLLALPHLDQPRKLTQTVARQGRRPSSPKRVEEYGCFFLASSSSSPPPRLLGVFFCSAVLHSSWNPRSHCITKTRSRFVPFHSVDFQNEFSSQKVLCLWALLFGRDVRERTPFAVLFGLIDLD